MPRTRGHRPRGHSAQARAASGRRIPDPSGVWMLHQRARGHERLRRENPAKRFFAANEKASCAYMKVTTLPKVKRALMRLEHRITVPPAIADRARLAIERMIAIGGQHPLSPVPETTV